MNQQISFLYCVEEYLSLYVIKVFFFSCFLEEFLMVWNAVSDSTARITSGVKRFFSRAA